MDVKGFYVFLFYSFGLIINNTIMNKLILMMVTAIVTLSLEVEMIRDGLGDDAPLDLINGREYEGNYTAMQPGVYLR